MDFDIHSNNNISYYSLLVSIVIYVIVITYSILPLLTLSREPSKYIYYDSLAIAYDFTKKLLFLALPLLISLLITEVIFRHSNIEAHYLIMALLSSTLMFSVGISTGALVRIGTLLAKNEFRLYLAKGYALVASKAEDELTRVKYIIMSLNAYNQYLLRNTNFGIKNFDLIVSNVLSSIFREKKIFDFLIRNLDGNDLNLINYLTQFYNSDSKNDFFEKYSIKQKLKPFGAFVAAAIPIIISIIQLMVQ